MSTCTRNRRRLVASARPWPFCKWIGLRATQTVHRHVQALVKKRIRVTAVRRRSSSRIKPVNRRVHLVHVVVFMRPAVNRHVLHPIPAIRHRLPGCRSQRLVRYRLARRRRCIRCRTRLRHSGLIQQATRRLCRPDNLECFGVSTRDCLGIHPGPIRISTQCLRTKRITIEQRLVLFTCL